MCSGTNLLNVACAEAAGLPPPHLRGKIFSCEPGDVFENLNLYFVAALITHCSLSVVAIVIFQIFTFAKGWSRDQPATQRQLQMNLAFASGTTCHRGCRKKHWEKKRAQGLNFKMSFAFFAVCKHFDHPLTKQFCFYF